MGNKEMIHWWEGYVIIRIKGNKLERLINRMMNRRFAAWDLIRSSEDEAQLSIALSDFFQLRVLLKETGCRARIIRKKGLPFQIRRIKRRSGLFAGAISFVLILYMLSSMIWSVEIEGVKLPETEILIRQELAKLGVKPGSFKFKTEDESIIQRKIMERMPTVTWVGYRYEGTTAYLKVVEKTLPEQLSKTNPRHLVAKKKAIIYDFFVEQGQPMVKINQYVKPGDILVSGIIGKEDDSKIVSAKGKVWGEVWYESKVEVPLIQKRNVLTGDQKELYYIKIGKWPLKVWGYGDIPFKNHLSTDKEFNFNIKDWTFPISWVKETISSTKSKEVKISEQEALEIGKKLSRDQLYRKLQPEAEIKEENVLRKHLENGKVYIKMHYTVIEEIASEQLIIQGE